MTPVERVDISAITAREFRRRFRSGEGVPCIITGALQGLDPCTPEFLTAKLPDARLPARHYGKDHFKKPKTEWKKYSDLMQVTPAEFAALLHDRTAHVENIYMAQVAIGDTELGSLLRPIMQRLADTSGMEAAIDLNLWWGPAGHTEPLHYDSGDGTLLQLHGTKRAILFPPSQTRNLYPFPIRRNGIAPWVSQVYIDRPDYDRFPRMREALEHKVDITVNAGEVLFIPTNWWHEVSSVSEGYICSLNRFWKVSPLSRLFTNRLTPVVYPLSLFALAMMRRKARKAATQAGAA